MDTLRTEPAPSCHSLGTSMLLLALLEWSSPEDWPMGGQAESCCCWRGLQSLNEHLIQ